jgi:uncharacterized membrane protein YfcA
MTAFQLYQYAGCAAASVIIGLAKAGIAGLGIVATPVMAALFPARQSIGIMLPLLVEGDVCAISWYRKAIKWKIIARLLPFTAAGVVAGYFLMGRINDEMLKTVIGLLVITFVLFSMAARNRIRPHHRSNLALAGLLGIFAGIATMLANASGPLMIAYLLLMGIRKEEFIGTNAWYYFILNLFKVPFLIDLGLITPATFKLNLIMLPFVIAGAIGGILVVKKINQRLFERIAALLALAAGIKCLLPG